MCSNLYVIDYIKDNPTTTIAEFKLVWNALESATKKVSHWFASSPGSADPLQEYQATSAAAKLPQSTAGESENGAPVDTENKKGKKGKRT